MKQQTFTKEYWDQNYSQPSTMDCIGNAKEHANYIHAFFTLELIDISSIIDFGAGYGHLFQKCLKKFIPYKACAIEPSDYAFLKLKKKKLKPVDSTNLSLFNESLQEWVIRKESNKVRFDLGICTSVFQYLTKEELELVIPIMATRVKYLYLTVPTDKELDRQIDDLDFHDQYALRRSRKFYQNLLSKHFTNISSKIWESKKYFDEETTLFTDLLYRN